MNKLCWLLRLVYRELVGKPGVEEHERPRHHIVEVYLWRSDSDLVICHKEVVHYLAWSGIGEDRERPALWNIQEIQPTHLRVGVDMRLVRTHAGHLLRPHTRGIELMMVKEVALLPEEIRSGLAKILR